MVLNNTSLSWVGTDMHVPIRKILKPYRHETWLYYVYTTFQKYIFWRLSSVQSLSHVQLFVTPWIAACQASLSITNSWSLLKLMSTELVMPSSHLILWHPPQHKGLFQWVSSSHEVAKVLEFLLQHQSFQWTPRTDLLQDGLVGSPCSPRW